MNLQEYKEQSARDPNLWWRLSSGEHLNLFEEALDRIEELEMKYEPIAPDEPHG